VRVQGLTPASGNSKALTDCVAATPGRAFDAVVLPHARYGFRMFENSSGGLLPGAELIELGIRDLDREVESVEALLVSIGAPRLRWLGLPIEHPIPSAEMRLYRLLGEEHGDAAQSRYNALVRRLVSYERAATRLQRARFEDSPG
jgi:hypothetical protein